MAVWAEKKALNFNQQHVVGFVLERRIIATARGLRLLDRRGEGGLIGFRDCDARLCTRIGDRQVSDRHWTSETARSQIDSAG